MAAYNHKLSQDVSNRKELTDGNVTIPFVKNAMEMLDKSSAFWCNPEYHQETLCYPACLDVLDNRVKSLDPKLQSNRTGQKGEDIVSALFQRLNMYCVVIGGFDSENFYNKLMTESKKQFPSFNRKALTALCQKVADKYGNKNMECDFLLFHPKIGLYVVEVKAAEKFEDDAFEKANKQLDKILGSAFFQKLATIFTGQEIELPVHEAIFFPFADLTAVKKEWRGSYKLLDVNQANQETFNDYWQKQIRDAGQCNFSYSNCLPLIATLIGYRSIVHISACRNIMKVHEMIITQEGLYEKHDTRKKKAALSELEQYDSSMFLTPEQLAVMQVSPATCKFQVICGPHGCGKTLLVLLKALEALKLRSENEKQSDGASEGKVIVEARNESLVQKFSQFFKANASSTPNTTPTVAGNFYLEWIESHSAPFHHNDDYFSDEVGYDFMQVCRRRRNAKGLTFFAVTGNVYVTSLYGLMDIKELVLDIIPDASVFQLNSSMRGTINIIEHWKNYFENDELRKFVSVGHCISGPIVKEQTALEDVPLADQVTDIIQSLIRHKNSIEKETPKKPIEKETPSVKSKDIAVICNFDSRADYGRHTVYDRASILRKKMKENGVPCGSVEDQVKDELLVAVDDFTKTFSLEWPVVLVLCNKSDESDGCNNFMMVASSRAMVRLVILYFLDEHDVSHAEDVCIPQLVEDIVEGVVEIVEKSFLLLIL